VPPNLPETIGNHILISTSTIHIKPSPNSTQIYQSTQFPSLSLGSQLSSSLFLQHPEKALGCFHLLLEHFQYFLDWIRDHLIYSALPATEEASLYTPIHQVPKTQAGMSPRPINASIGQGVFITRSKSRK
jgi:hypothetical protein